MFYLLFITKLLIVLYLRKFIEYTIIILNYF